MPSNAVGSPSGVCGASHARSRLCGDGGLLLGFPHLKTNASALGAGVSDARRGFGSPRRPRRKRPGGLAIVEDSPVAVC